MSLVSVDSDNQISVKYQDCKYQSSCVMLGMLQCPFHSRQVNEFIVLTEKSKNSDRAFETYLQMWNVALPVIVQHSCSVLSNNW
jgi:hypothetical protein